MGFEVFVTIGGSSFGYAIYNVFKKDWKRASLYAILSSLAHFVGLLLLYWEYVSG